MRLLLHAVRDGAADPGARPVLPTRWIVFPTRDGSQTQLRALSRPGGLRRSMQEALVLPERLDRRKVESPVRGMRALECWELRAGALDRAVEEPRRLTGLA